MYCRAQQSESDTSLKSLNVHPLNILQQTIQKIKYLYRPQRDTIQKRSIF